MTEDQRKQLEREDSAWRNYVNSFKAYVRSWRDFDGSGKGSYFLLLLSNRYLDLWRKAI